MANGFILNVCELDLTPVGERRVQLPIRLGRSSLNDVVVAHRLVSEFHARIEEVDGKLCVRDLSSKNGVFVEKVGGASAARVAAGRPTDLEPYGFEFLMSPLLRVRVRPASSEDLERVRQSEAEGSVLGNARLLAGAGSALAEDMATEGYLPPSPSPSPRVPPAATAPPAPEAGGMLRAAPSPGAPQGQARGALAPAALAPAAPLRSPAPPPLDGGARSPRLQGAPERPKGNVDVYSASPAAQPYESVFIEPPSAPLELGDAGASLARHVALPPLPHSADARFMEQAAERPATVLEPAPANRALPNLTNTAWGRPTRTEAGVPSAEARDFPSDEPTRALESLALRGLRELAASLLPGQTIEQTTDVVRIVTKLHDAIEIFCRCFIPVREACSRFIPVEELELSAVDRCRRRSNAYLAVERAREPGAVAAALLNCRHEANDAPAAVENILADLMLHHLAFSQGAIEGVRALLDELSPGPGDSQASRASGLLSRLGIGVGNDRASEESNAQRHAELQAAGKRFRDLFGEEFTRAYREHWSQQRRGAKER
jgi:predicted component of type VI protein secretion system